MSATIQKLWKTLLILALTSLVVFIFYSDEKKNEKLRDDDIPIVFYKEAYLDYRYSPPRIRVFSINPCLHSQSTLLIKIGSKFLKLSGEPLEGECPWAWAPTCYYNSYIFETSVTDSDFRISENISIILQNKNSDVPLKVIHPKTKEGLTVCVQPVYLYSQFQNIILFIEVGSWRNQGATHFIVYFHSSTNEVWMVLDHYQRLGILTIKPWPKFGDVPARYPEINSQVYRIGHTMAANLCILKMNTTLGTIVDFDEIIVPTTGSPNILESSRQSLKEAKVGALEFKHTRLQLDLNSEKTGFERKSLENPILLEKSGPVKLVFNTSSVGITLTHSIKKFINSSLKTIEVSIGLLLHYRYNGGQEAMRNKNTNFKIFEKNFEAHIRNIDTVTKSIFQEKRNLYEPRIILELNECIEEMSALIVTTRKRVLLGTLSMRSDKLVTDLTMHLNSPYTCMIILTSIFALFYLFFSYQPSMQYSVNFEETILDDQINSSFPITFYHNAYVDYRFTPPRLRIFSLNQCIKPNKNFLLVDIFYEGVSEPTQMKVFGEPLEGACPSTYGPAKPCFYVAHTFFTDLIMTGGMTKVLLHMGSRKVTLSVKEINKRFEKGITLCLQPVYYYSQWQNIVLYIEAWKAQGATRFIVFYHSSTKDTKRVLDYYRGLGIIELRSWPSFGSLPSEIEAKNPKIDDSVFIFSYFLAMNICILDIKTTIGTIADFDEVMVPRNGTMLDYATREMTGTNVGALSFGNNYVAMDPSIYSSDFSGVSKPIFISKGGPSKYIFNASVIDLAQVHWAKSFTDSSKKSKGGDGGLLHLRYGFDPSKEKTVEKQFRFFPNNQKEHIRNMQDTANKIFNGSVPTFNSNFIDILNDCVKQINKRGKTCRSTGGMCKKEMDKVNEWVYDKTEGIFLSGA